MAQKAKQSEAQSILSRDLSRLMNEITKLRQSVTFSSALDYLMTTREITNDAMEERTGLCRDTISRYRTQPEKDPPLKTVTLLCLALHLEPELSDEMLRLAGRNIRAVRNDILCRKLLREKYAWDMDDIDAYLVAEGFEPISKRYKLAS